ncbi:amino acid ABC transporter substrate-binding protein [Microvirga sp. VF16]|uniref:amino acid ABC transporter substrate-binding protein n=1 Tax=Microvirga sp. VF16 TaxID=2807101 RepID=UPI00193D5F67|nr:amino acid ABC transporter substrate-binding protein [Microvirga sp. VF16]QRM35284.1 amino acid ABC transporter substrate-binding protein [Microvirga sp. VF16]
MTNRRFMAALLTIGLASTVGLPAQAQQTVEQIKQRGYIICGASQGNVGFSAPDEKGVWKGLDVDTCRAVAVAILGDKDKARFVPLTGPQRLTALQTGEIDVLPRTTTWTLRRDANGLNFSFPNYYEYDGFLLSRKLGVTETKQMKGASVCLQTGSTTEVTLADLSRKYNLDLKPILFDNVPATRQAFFSGRCDALISDASALATTRATQAPNPDDYVIFPASGHFEGLAPSVRHGDDRFYDIVKWSFQALIAAEDMGISQANVDEMLKSSDPQIQRFLGMEPGNGQALGLDEKWAYNIIKQLGNYGEIFDRHIGKNSPIKLDRGPNKLHKDGGLMFPLVFN